MNRDEHYLHINGIELFYTATGRGDPVILLHGGVSSHAMWDAFVPFMAKDHRVYALDMRGHGRSEYDDRGISYPLLADDLAEFIRVLELGKPHLIGYSSGGNVALEFGVRYPDHAATLTIGAAWLRIDPAMREAVERDLGFVKPGVVDFDVVRRAMGSSIAKWEVEHGVRYGINHWQRLYEFMCEMDFTPHSNHGDQLQRISCPTLVFSGDRDGIIPLDQVVEQFESIPDAELLIMPGTNHFTALKKTEWLTDAIVEFIERH